MNFYANNKFIFRSGSDIEGDMIAYELVEYFSVLGGDMSMNSGSGYNGMIDVCTTLSPDPEEQFQIWVEESRDGYSVNMPESTSFEPISSILPIEIKKNNKYIISVVP